MINQIINIQGMKSVAVAALIGLGLDLSSCPLCQMLWSVAHELLSTLLWGVLTGWQAQVLDQHAYWLDCPLQLAQSLSSLAHCLSSAL
jgi:hypothetical protein